MYLGGNFGLGRITNTLAYGNATTTQFGAGIRLATGAVTLTQVTLANNTGGPGFSRANWTEAAISNSIIWGNSNNANATWTWAACSIDQSGKAGPALDPMFAGPGMGGDYRPVFGGPAVDAGEEQVSRWTSTAGRGPKNGRYDTGAYEDPVHRLWLPLVMRQ